MKDEPTVSVIVPVYNVENFLEKCVDSIIMQTYKNLEIILVDDGSSDKCPQICDEYAVKDDRVKVIHKANGGLSDARNAGIDIASGEYLVFVDSDDYIADTAINMLYLSIINDGVDIAVAGMDSVDEHGNYKSIYLNEKKVICSGVDAFYKIFTDKSAIGAPNRMYRTDIVRKNRFRVGVLHEDVYFSADVFLSPEVEKVSFLPFVGYYYYRRAGSIMQKALTVSPRVDLIQSYDYLLKKAIESVKDKTRLLAIDKHCIACLTKFSLLPQYNSSREYDLYLHRFLKKNWLMVDKLQFSGHYRQRLKLFYKCPILYRLLKGILHR